MGRFTRRPEIDRRRRRRAKIGRIKAKLMKTTDKNEIGKLIEKIKKIHPFYPMQEAVTK